MRKFSNLLPTKVNCPSRPAVGVLEYKRATILSAVSTSMTFKHSKVAVTSVLWLLSSS